MKEISQLDDLILWAERNLGKIMLSYGAAAWIAMIVILVVMGTRGR